MFFKTFFYWHIMYQLLNMLNIKRDISNTISKSLTSIFSNLTDFHSLEIVNRVSETQLQVGENFQLNKSAVMD